MQNNDQDKTQRCSKWCGDFEATRAFELTPTQHKYLV
jgi:hypothetical protein